MVFNPYKKLWGLIFLFVWFLLRSCFLLRGMFFCCGVGFCRGAFVVELVFIQGVFSFLELIFLLWVFVDNVNLCTFAADLSFAFDKMQPKSSFAIDKMGYKSSFAIDNGG